MDELCQYCGRPGGLVEVFFSGLSAQLEPWLRGPVPATPRQRARRVMPNHPRRPDVGIGKRSHTRPARRQARAAADFVQNEYRRRKREKKLLVKFEISRAVVRKLTVTGWLLDHEQDDKAQVSETLRALVEDMRPPENT